MLQTILTLFVLSTFTATATETLISHVDDDEITIPHNTQRSGSLQPPPNSPILNFESMSNSLSTPPLDVQPPNTPNTPITPLSDTIDMDNMITILNCHNPCSSVLLIKNVISGCCKIRSVDNSHDIQILFDLTKSLGSGSYASVHQVIINQPITQPSSSQSNQNPIRLAMKVSKGSQNCHTLHAEHATLVALSKADISETSLMIDPISKFQIHRGLPESFEKAKDDRNYITCAFLEELVDNALNLNDYFLSIEQSGYFNSSSSSSTGSSSVDTITWFTSFFNDINIYLIAMHNIGWLHGDIQWSNILIGNKIDVWYEIEFINNTTVYKYINKENTNTTRAYLIDYGSSVNLWKLDAVNNDKYRFQIMQTYLFGHPHFYKYLAYWEARQKLYKSVKKWQLSAVEGYIWQNLIICENYALASTFTTIFASFPFVKEINNEKYMKKMDKLMGDLNRIQIFPRYGSIQLEVIIAVENRILKLQQYVMETTLITRQATKELGLPQHVHIVMANLISLLFPEISVFSTYLSIV